MVSNEGVYIWPGHSNLFCGITHEWMSSAFEVFFSYWFLVLSLLSSWYDMNVCDELLEGDVWASEYNKPGFLSFGVDIFDRLYLKETPISLPILQWVL